MAASATYNTIVVSENPRGRFFDGIIVGTPKPGTVMQLKTATEPVNNKWSWVPYDRDADGDHPRGPIAVLREDSIQGKTVTDAFTTGTIGSLYCPLPGDLLLMIIADVAGTTSDTHAIGDILMVDDSTGTLVVTTGSPETECFVCMETFSTGFSADALGLVMCTGY